MRDPVPTPASDQSVTPPPLAVSPAPPLARTDATPHPPLFPASAITVEPEPIPVVEPAVVEPAAVEPAVVEPAAVERGLADWLISSVAAAVK